MRLYFARLPIGGKLFRQDPEGAGQRTGAGDEFFSKNTHIIP
jgi:hypothetical protein